MNTVTISKPIRAELEAKGVINWPVWEKEVSRFDWYYDHEEHCYILEGHFVVETDTNNYEVNPGDYVVFPKGLQCIWDIKAPVRKHYRFV